MSFDFLFIRKDVKGIWLQRLFGPDSLCPNLRDIRDVVGMVRWFLFMGPKPTFERWTYWEKFDFLAVFWGMFAIGGSGLMLWFPEFFGYFLPGWMFNVATIIHSDEALLATGFIFTVHFLTPTADRRSSRWTSSSSTARWPRRSLSRSVAISGSAMRKRGLPRSSPASG